LFVDKGRHRVDLGCFAFGGAASAVPMQRGRVIMIGTGFGSLR